MAVASPAWAETFTVTNTSDSGPGSLRQAIADANATSEADTIDFASSARGTITLTSQLRVINDLTIEGPGPQALTISGNHAVRPLEVGMSTRLDFSGVTIANGRASGSDPLTFPENAENHGGAISNAGTLTIRNSVLRDNLAVNRGGAIFNLGGKVNVVDSTLNNNRSFLGAGGAIHNLPYSLFGQQHFPQATVTGSTLRSNFADRGGALYNPVGSDASITDSTLSGNRAGDDKNGFEGGGVYTTGNLVVQRSTFSGNFATTSGGGLYSGSGSTRVDDVTFHGNGTSTGTGGGVAFGGDGAATMTNSTLSGNRAHRGGGGFSVSGTATNATTVRGSIVAGNTASFGNPNGEGGYTNGGFNVVEGTAAEAGLRTDANGRPVLSDNGGPTQTVALVRGSRAVDAGNSFGSTTDQRGTPRPKDYASVDDAQGGDGSDVGAFEYVDPDAAPPTVEASSSPLPNGGGLNNSDVTVAINATDEEGGSGLWRVSYSASGAQTVPEQNVSGASAEFVVSAEGETIVTYWATDGAGNRSESRTLAVRIDKTLPETSIGSGPSGPTKGAASFVFSSDDPNATFECKLDGAAFEACSSPKDYSALNDGDHTLEVRAIDAAGNVDTTPAMRSWTVDTTRPTGKVLINNGRASVTTRAVTLKLKATDSVPASGVASMRFKNKGSTAWSAWQPHAGSKAWRLTSGTGKKTVYVQYKDRAGNVSASAQDSITYQP